jgi:L-methionine (R)-S-oxide reductase
MIQIKVFVSFDGAKKRLQPALIWQFGVFFLSYLCFLNIALTMKTDISKETLYKDLLAKGRALTDGESDMVAKMANVAALLHQGLYFWWTGFYRVIGGELVLGPFQGPVACICIPYGMGVCGTAWKEARTIVVPDVEKFPGHIACSSESRSEIVVPVRGVSGEITAVLDIDSAELSAFDEVDARWLEEIAGCL